MPSSSAKQRRTPSAMVDTNSLNPTTTLVPGISSKQAVSFKKNLEFPLNTKSLKSSSLVSLTSAVTNSYTRDSIEYKSMEFLLNDIRFTLFPTITKQQLTDLWILMYYMPIRKSDLLDPFLSILNNRDWTALTAFIETNTMENVKTVGLNGKYVHDFDKEMDLYMALEDPTIAIGIFREILFLPFEGQEPYDLYLETVSEYIKENSYMLKFISNRVIWNSELI